MASPEISVILPVYNRRRLIERVVQSVNAQSNVELIVIDGGSTDGTSEWLADCPSVTKLVSESDHGIYDAMNKGVDLANGEWFYFLGADDQLNDGALEKLLLQRKPEARVIYGAISNLGVSHKAVPTFMQSNVGRGMMWRNTLHHQSAIYHRSLFNGYRYNPEFKVLADYHLNLKCFLEKVEVVKTTIEVARCDAAGISKSFPPSLYREELDMKRTLLNPVQMTVQAVWVWCKYLYKKALG